MKRIYILAFLFLVLIFILFYKDYANLSINEMKDLVILKNSKVTLVFKKKNARLVSLKTGLKQQDILGNHNGYYCLYYQLNGKQYKWIAENGEMNYHLVSKDKDKIEIMFDVKDKSKCPLNIEVHYVLFRQSSGFYIYVTLKYDGSPKDLKIEQSNYILFADQKMFTHYMVDDETYDEFPTPSELRNGEEISDAVYKLKNGKIYTKYENARPVKSAYVYTILSKKQGISMIIPSSEYVSGGIDKQELTLHQSLFAPVLLWYGHSLHYGTGYLSLYGNWSKIYGPVFVYANKGLTHKMIYNDAKSMAKKEVKKWPYKWMCNDLYSIRNRKIIKGKLVNSKNLPISNAWVKISSVQDDNYQDALGYNYYGKTDFRGRFSIAGVRKGDYNFYAYKDGEFERFKQPIKIDDLFAPKIFKWNLTNKNIIWQIGYPDRSSKEYKNGDRGNIWGTYLQYKKEFPKAMDYFVGKSMTKDIHYFVPSTDPQNQLKIHFELNEKSSDKTLTIALASSVYSSLKIDINDKTIRNNLSTGLPTNDRASYRCGVYGVYRLIKVSIDKKYFKNGENIITITPVSQNFDLKNGIMYDSIKLENN